MAALRAFDPWTVLPSSTFSFTEAEKKLKKKKSGEERLLGLRYFNPRGTYMLSCILKQCLQCLSLGVDDFSRASRGLCKATFFKRLTSTMHEDSFAKKVFAIFERNNRSTFCLSCRRLIIWHLSHCLTRFYVNLVQPTNAGVRHVLSLPGA